MGRAGAYVSGGWPFALAVSNRGSDRVAHRLTDGLTNGLTNPFTLLHRNGLR
jgi:hypothetical protein